MSDDDREVKTDKSGHVEKVLEPSDDPDLPEPTIDDPQPDRAPGGVDATTAESDVGAGDHSADELLVADQPLAAQTDEVDVPDALQEGEDTDEPSAENGDDPKASKPD
jgi:hypothetical protein